MAQLNPVQQAIADAVAAATNGSSSNTSTPVVRSVDTSSLQTTSKSGLQA
jgi:hypothetical protein